VRCTIMLHNARIETNEIRMLRWMCVVKKKDQIRNECIRGTTGVTLASIQITEKLLNRMGV